MEQPLSRAISVALIRNNFHNIKFDLSGFESPHWFNYEYNMNKSNQEREGNNTVIKSLGTLSMVFMFARENITE